MPDPVPDQTQPQGTAENPTPLTARPPGGTAVMQALGGAAAVGAAAGSAAAQQFGSMGLRGWMQNLGNATAMMVFFVFFFLVFNNWTATMKSEREYQREEMRVQREYEAKSRESTNSEIRSLASEIRAMMSRLEAAGMSKLPARNSTPGKKETAPMPKVAEKEGSVP